MNLKKYLKEASEVDFNDFEKSKQNIITSLVGKGNTNKQQYFSGIHGDIVSFNSIYGNRIRLKKEDLKKILNDKNVRWIDIAAIGF